MKECWAEGDLRAYIDRELPPADMERVKAHLETCSECGDHWAMLAGRAERVSSLMGTLAEVNPKVTVFAGRPRVAWRWAGAAAALAAGLLVWMFLVPKNSPRGIASAPAPPSEAPRVSPVPPPEPAAATVAVEPAHPVRTVQSRRPRRLVPAPSPGAGPFLALDDEPIDTGVVWRVELGPRAIPADVIVGSDGRPRAIRLVNSKANH